MRVDDINIPFVDDGLIMGNWIYANFVRSIGDFMPGSEMRGGETYLSEIKFLADGGLNVKVGSGELGATSFTWSNGHILNHADLTNSAYTIQQIDGVDYLFIEWKSGDYIFRGSDPHYYVFKREEIINE